MTTYLTLDTLHGQSSTEVIAGADPGWKTAFLLGGFKAGRRYFLYVRCAVKGDTTANNKAGKVQVYDNSNGVVMPESYQNKRTQSTSHYQDYCYFTVFDAGIGTDDSLEDSKAVSIQIQKGPATTNYFYAKDFVITAIDITDLVEDRDYIWSELITDSTIGTSLSDRATKTLTLDSSGLHDGDWMICGTETYDTIGTINEDVGVRLDWEHGSSIETSPEHRLYTSYNSTTAIACMGRPYNLAYSTNSSATFTVQDKTYGSTAATHKRSAIFGLRLAAFDASGDVTTSSYDETYVENSKTNEKVTESVVAAAHDTETHSYIVFGMSVFDGEATGRSIRHFIRQEESSGSDKDLFVSPQTYDRTYRNTDRLTFLMVVPATVEPDTDDNTFELSFRKDSSATYGCLDNGIAIARMRIAKNTYVWDGSTGDGSLSTADNWTPSGLPGPRDKVVFNSGSVNVTGGSLNVFSAHVAGTYSGSISSGSSLAFKRMNITSPHASVKFTTAANGRYAAGSSSHASPKIYFTNGSMEDNTAVITSGTGRANCIANGTRGTIYLLGNYWNDVVLSAQRSRYKAIINGTTANLVVDGNCLVDTNAQITNAYLIGVGACELNIKDNTVLNLYVMGSSAAAYWQSDDRGGHVHLYQGAFSLTRAQVAYYSDGLYIYGSSTFDGRTGIDGFWTPTSDETGEINFDFYGSSRARLLFDEGQVVTPGGP